MIHRRTSLLARGKTTGLKCRASKKGTNNVPFFIELSSLQPASNKEIAARIRQAHSPPVQLMATEFVTTEFTNAGGDAHGACFVIDAGRGRHLFSRSVFACR